MQKINTKELEQKWKDSKCTINQLLLNKDKTTIKMMQFYKLYITSPLDITAKTLFEYSFSDWYRENKNNIERS